MRAIGGLLTIAAAKVISPIVKILQGQLARLILVIHPDDDSTVTYVIDDPAE